MSEHAGHIVQYSHLTGYELHKKEIRISTNRLKPDHREPTLLNRAVWILICRKILSAAVHSVT